MFKFNVYRGVMGFLLSGGLYLAANKGIQIDKGLKDPEFVPIYDENDRYLGLTHPRLVEIGNELRGEVRKSVVNDNSDKCNQAEIIFNTCLVY